MPTQQQIEMVMWAIRSLRLIQAVITAESVQKFTSLNSIDITLEAIVNSETYWEVRMSQQRNTQAGGITR